MKLERFRITNYRSIKDSGWIEAGQRTVFVGRNESGKSNLLLALRTLKPASKLEPLTLTRDFPADVSRASYSDDLDVVRSVWMLSDDERAELAKLHPRARNTRHVEVGRGFGAECWVRFEGLSDESPVDESPRARRSAMPAAPSAARPELASAPFSRFQRDAAGLVIEADANEDLPRPDFAGELLARIAGGENPEPMEEADELESESIDPEKQAREWVLERLPRFLYLDEYPDIDGQQNLCAFLKRQNDRKPAPGDEYFEKLLIAAELDPRGIDRLLTSDPDSRRQIVNHAGAVLTRKLRQLWSDRALKVRFDLDGEQFHTLVSDPNSVYDVEINLSSRSRGFRWFFSFYVSFAADQRAGSLEDTILLLDEPGLHLHPLGQRDLLDHLARDFDNQVLLTTQSPFMVPADDLGSVRTVSISEQGGTTVSTTPSGDEKTLFPLRHALAVEIARHLLDGEIGLVCEEISDLWYLRGVSNLIRERGGVGLPSQLSILPAGGSASVAYMSALLSGQKSRAIVLRSEHPASDLVKQPAVAALAPESNAVFIGDPGSETPSKTADVEDLLDPRIYDQLVRNAYKTQLGERTLEPDEAQPRIVKRYEKALSRLGLELSRERVARVFLRAMSQNPDAVLPDTSREQFERLFRAVRAKYEPLV